MSEISMTELLKETPSNWGKWGEDDDTGAVRYLDQEQVLRAVGSVRKGRTFTLGIDVCTNKGDPVAPGRIQPQRFMLRDKGHYEAGKITRLKCCGGGESSEDMVSLPLHGTTHFDALGHVWYDDKLYNGYDANSTKGGLQRCSIRPVAEHGVVGRAVLADLARHKQLPHLEAGYHISFEELRACLEQQGSQIEKRDILLIRTGWLNVFFAGRIDEFYGDDMDKPDRSFNLVEPGLTYEKELVQWFYDMEIPALCTDTLGNEQTFSSTTGTHFPLHRALIRDQGMLFGEIMHLEELAEDCATDRRYDCMFVASPLKIFGGTGSPANPIAIK